MHPHFERSWRAKNGAAERSDRYLILTDDWASTSQRADDFRLGQPADSRPSVTLHNVWSVESYAKMPADLLFSHWYRYRDQWVPTVVRRTKFDLDEDHTVLAVWAAGMFQDATNEHTTLLRQLLCGADSSFDNNNNTNNNNEDEDEDGRADDEPPTFSFHGAKFRALTNGKAIYDVARAFDARLCSGEVVLYYRTRGDREVIYGDGGCENYENCH